MASNPVQLKIIMAKHLLDMIPSRIPKSESAQMKLEVDAEIFLFFSSSMIEIIKRQINDKFEIFDKKNIFYIHGVRKNLANTGVQKKVKAQIANYFTTPYQTKSRINVSKSSLWRLQALKNQAMHGNVITIRNNTAIFSYTIRDGKKSHTFEQKSQNPRKYFGQIFCDLVQFRAEISRLLR